MILFQCVIPIHANAGEADNNEKEIGTLKSEVSQLKETIKKMQELIEKQQTILEGLQKERGEKPSEGEQSLSKVNKPAPEVKSEENALVSQPMNQPNWDTSLKSTDVAKAIQSFNPDMSVIGDFTGHWSNRGSRDVNRDRFSLRELELAFGGSIDPYARGDIFLSFGEQNDGTYQANIEEGYISFLNLPFDLQAKLGKFKASFGKANTFHTHQMPFVTNPNFINNYFGEEQLAEPGVSVNYLISNPWDKYIELTVEGFNNGNEKSFAGGAKSNDLVYLAHLKNFFDLSENSTFELGLSTATGPNDSGHGRKRTTLEGIDLTYKWKPLREGLYKSLTWQTEFLMSQNNKKIQAEVDSFGMYSSLQYQFQRRWTAGLRYDYSEFPDSASKHENAYSANLTFAQSEFAFLRLEYRHTDRNFEKNTNELWLQLDFGMGPHRAHKY